MMWGYARERAMIDDLLSAARGGSGSALLVIGSPCSGRSTLLDCAIRAATDMLTLSARGVRDESDLAYSGLRILLQPVLAHLTNLSSDRAAALRKVLDPEQGAGSTPAGGHLVGTAVLDLLATAAARRP